MNDTLVAAPDLFMLYQLATGQMGYFTSAQAREVGVSRSLLHHHAKSGRFERAYRGVYRFRDFPPTPREEVAAAWLAVGKDIGVVSHETALDLLNLTDNIPNTIDVTVPRARRYLRVPDDVTLHTTTRPIGPADTTVREGIRITSPSRTIVDVAEAGLSEEHVQTAVREAIGRGWANAGLLRGEAEHHSRRVRDMIDRATGATAS